MLSSSCSTLFLRSSVENTSRNKLTPISYPLSGFMEALCEDVLAEESLTNTLAILLNPGIQYDTWTAGISALIDKNLVTIITGKSHLDKMTTDAVHCERILTSFYGANMLINTTKTPARQLDVVVPGLFRNLFYVAFQGRNTTGGELVMRSCWITSNTFLVILIFQYIL